MDHLPAFHLHPQRERPRARPHAAGRAQNDTQDHPDAPDSPPAHCMRRQNDFDAEGTAGRGWGTTEGPRTRTRKGAGTYARPSATMRASCTTVRLAFTLFFAHELFPRARHLTACPLHRDAARVPSPALSHACARSFWGCAGAARTHVRMPTHARRYRGPSTTDLVLAPCSPPLARTRPVARTTTTLPRHAVLTPFARTVEPTNALPPSASASSRDAVLTPRTPRSSTSHPPPLRRPKV